MSEKELPLEGHLEEIRRRIFVSLLFFFLVSVAAFFFVDRILEILKWPSAGRLETLAVFSPTAAILSFIKLSFAAGFVVSLPLFLYQVWVFVSPAMEERHARKGSFFIVVSTLLFLLGALFSFFILVPAALAFLLGIGGGELQYMISLDSYVSFVLLFVFAGGLVFQMPVAAFLLARFGVLESGAMLKHWRVALVAILIAAAILTPTPDLVNMLLLSFPMFGLYLVSIAVAAWAEKIGPVSPKSLLK